MKINKSLKFANFSYEEGSKTFTIEDEGGNAVELNKVYSFAFMRFVIRIAQRNWLRSLKKDKKSVDISEDIMIESELENFDNPNQLIFEEIENEFPPAVSSPQPVEPSACDTPFTQ